MNPCACGYLGDRSGRCSCSPDRIRTYRARLSGPLLDRIDVHVSLPPVNVSSLHGGPPGESSAVVRARVEAARDRQIHRVKKGETCATLNAALHVRDVERVAVLCDAGARLLAAAVSQLGFSARAYGKVLRVARTIADLDDATRIGPAHVAEAIGARVLDRAIAPGAAA
jgi:magnesium chelatase family protein